MSLRREALRLYKRLLSIGNNWKALNHPEETAKQREYIRSETREQFRKNRDERSEDRVRELLKEGEKRIQIAEHYGIPYDRPVYLPPESSYDVRSKEKVFKIRQPKADRVWRG